MKQNDTTYALELHLSPGHTSALTVQHCFQLRSWPAVMGHGFGGPKVSQIDGFLLCCHYFCQISDVLNFNFVTVPCILQMWSLDYLAAEHGFGSPDANLCENAWACSKRAKHGKISHCKKRNFILKNLTLLYRFIIFVHRSIILMQKGNTFRLSIDANASPRSYLASPLNSLGSLNLSLPSFSEWIFGKISHQKYPTDFFQDL